METDEHVLDQGFMRRAFELALRGTGAVSPNPLVGSVIVYNGKIIGEGWHEKYGQSHAEVNAVNSVKDPSLLSKSTMYVTLEPCNHTGKTPPCTDLLLDRKFQRVVISNVDPNPIASGGIKKLKDSGIRVDTGLLENEGYDVNRRFFTFINKKRPYVILKWAETSDGFIARENYDSKWISNEYSRQLVHRWRSEEDAVMVGTGTAHFDNPMLNVRDWNGRNPTRIIIDRELKLKRDLNIFDRSQPTIIYNSVKDEESENLVLKSIYGNKFLEGILTDLYERDIQSVIVEGGTETLRHFIDNSLWDEIRRFKSEKVFTSGIASPLFEGNLIQTESVMNDTLSIYKPISHES